MADKTFEDRLFDAVVQQFFAPQWQASSVFNPTTGQTEQTMIQIQSPVSRLASDLYQLRSNDILNAVKEKVDFDALVEGIWLKVKDDWIKRLTDTSFYSQYQGEQQKLRDRVHELIAQELANRALAKMDAETDG